MIEKIPERIRDPRPYSEFRDALNNHIIHKHCNINHLEINLTGKMNSVRISPLIIGVFGFREISCKFSSVEEFTKFLDVAYNKIINNNSQ